MTALARLRHYWAVALSGAISMTSKFSVGALVGAWMLVASYCPANALTFHFSFNNGPSNDAAQGLVQGTISGLQDNLALQHATSVQVTSNAAGFGLGEYIGSPANNSFTVSGGVLTSDSIFTSFGSFNASPAVTCCSFLLILSNINFAGLSAVSNGVSISGSTNLVITAVSEAPLPAALPLFATGLGALGLIGWRRKRKAAV